MGDEASEFVGRKSVRDWVKLTPVHPPTIEKLLERAVAVQHVGCEPTGVVLPMRLPAFLTVVCLADLGCLSR